jgi:hypothetical protein
VWMAVVRAARTCGLKIIGIGIGISISIRLY